MDSCLARVDHGMSVGGWLDVLCQVAALCRFYVCSASIDR
jgi:hypothetical protein